MVHRNMAKAAIIAAVKKEQHAAVDNATQDRIWKS